MIHLIFFPRRSGYQVGFKSSKAYIHFLLSRGEMQDGMSVALLRPEVDSITPGRLESTPSLVVVLAVQVDYDGVLLVGC